MHLVTFLEHGEVRVGALLVRDGYKMIVDLNRYEPRLPASMLDFLAAGESDHALADDVHRRAPATAMHKLEEVALQATIPNPSKIICIGLNYRDHAAETHQSVPEVPMIFAKYANTLIGPGEAIGLPHVTQRVDYEAELTGVMGKRGRYLAETEAMDYVAGYSPFTDLRPRAYPIRTTHL